MKTYKIRNKEDGEVLEVTEDQLTAYGLEVPNQMAKGGMIKRADGSYSRRGLWDNIRANKGSGKKPTKAMLAQEKKIRAAEKAYGGYMDMGGYMNYGGYMAEGGINNPGFRALPDYVQQNIIDNMASGGCMQCGGKMQDGGTPLQQYLQKYPYRPETDTLAGSPFYGNTPMSERQRVSDLLDARNKSNMKGRFGMEEKMYPNVYEWDPDSYPDVVPANQPLKPIMESGGKMPQWLAEVRFKAAGKEDELGDYGYLDEAGDGKWIQKATASIKRRGTEGVCTGSKFGGPGCPPGSKRYNLAKTFRKMAKSKKEEGGYTQGGEYEMTDAEIAKLRSMGYKIKEV